MSYSFHKLPILPLWLLFAFNHYVHSQDLIVSSPMTLNANTTYDNVIVQTGGTLTVNAILTVNQNMTIESGGTVNHTPRNLNGLTIEVNGTLEIENGGNINVDGRGLNGGHSGSIYGVYGETYNQNGNVVQGPGAIKIGASYGGYAGRPETGNPSAPYALIEQPDKLGSGGSAGHSGGIPGGDGGGRIRIIATDLILNGTISSNGAIGSSGAGTGGGGGSGGSIWISVSNLSGSSSGIISATGGRGGNVNTYAGSSGGGGRIAIEFDNNSIQFSQIKIESVPASNTYPGSSGTIYLKNNADPYGELILDNKNNTGKFPTPILTNLDGFKSIAIKNRAVLIHDQGTFSILDSIYASSNGSFILDPNAVINDPTIKLNDGNLYVNSNINFDNTSDILMSNQSYIEIAENVEFTIPDFNATNFKNGTILLKNNAKLFSLSNQFQINTGVTLNKDGMFNDNDIVDNIIIENGGNITHSVRNEDGLNIEVNGTVEIKTGGAINVDSRGLKGGRNGSVYGNYGETYNQNGTIVQGPGALKIGASYGGYAGRPETGNPSAPYGLIEQPDKLGSGGSAGHPSGTPGGNGGGKIRLIATNLILDGTISSDGGIGQSGSGLGSGGGSGGSIWISVSNLSGSSSGIISATGGRGGNVNTYAGSSGGGGRIAIEFDNNTFQNSQIKIESVPESNTYPGGSGTIYLKDNAEPYGELILDNKNKTGKFPTPILTNLDAFKIVIVRNRAALIHNQGTFSVTESIQVSSNGSLILDPNAVIENPTVLLNDGNFYVNSNINFNNASDFILENQSYLEIGATAEFSIPDFETTNFINGAIFLKENTKLSVASNQIHINSGVGLTKDGSFGDSDFIGQLTIEGGGSITHSTRFEDGLNINVDVLDIKTNGKVDVLGKGLYGGRWAGNIFTNGRGEAYNENGNIVQGANTYVGASYGGEGGLKKEDQSQEIVVSNSNFSNTPYGNIESPNQIGAGGGGGANGVRGGIGGGKVRVIANDIILNGNIIANGGESPDSEVFCGGGGGGAGGSIWITTQNISGTGTIEASGAKSLNKCPGCGGGGRIAIEYDALSIQENQIKAFGGENIYAKDAAAGTIFLKNTNSNTNKLILDNNNIQSPYWSWVITEIEEFEQIITKNNGRGILPESGAIHFPTINNTNCISGALAIPDDLIVELDDYNIEIGAGFTLEKSGKIGADDVLQDVFIQSGGSISHMPRSLNGLVLNSTSLVVESGGNINVSSKGLKGGNNGSQFGYFGETFSEDLKSIIAGAQGIHTGAGGSYGGIGETSTNNAQPGPVYGDKYYPNLLGAGGGGGSGFSSEGAGHGGGKIFINTQNLTLNGAVSANGSDGDSHAGGGSGGSVLIFAEVIDGSGSIQAKGGNGGCFGCAGGSGGGGRVAIYTSTPNFPVGNISVAPGPPDSGLPKEGTIVYKTCNYENNVAIDTILTPQPGILDAGISITPKVVVQNNSPVSNIFPIEFRIGNVYIDESYLNLAPGQKDTLEFTPWTVNQPGAYFAIASTKKAGDNCAFNNADTVQLTTDFGEGPIIYSVTPPRGGNNGNTTVKLSGLRFMEGIIVWLVSPNDDQITAHYVQVQSDKSLYASFNLDGVDLGFYDVNIQNPDMQSYAFSNGFEVEPGPFGWGGDANVECLANDFDPGQLLDFRMEHPSVGRRNRPFWVNIYFRNNSNIDIPVITKKFSTEAKEAVSFNICHLPNWHCYPFDIFSPPEVELLIEFKEENGPPNILRAGAGGSIEVWAMPTNSTGKIRFLLED